MGKLRGGEEKLRSQSSEGGLAKERVGRRRRNDSNVLDVHGGGARRETYGQPDVVYMSKRTPYGHFLFWKFRLTFLNAQLARDLSGTGVPASLRNIPDNYNITMIRLWTIRLWTNYFIASSRTIVSSFSYRAPSFVLFNYCRCYLFWRDEYY